MKVGNFHGNFVTWFTPVAPFEIDDEHNQETKSHFR